MPTIALTIPIEVEITYDVLPVEGTLPEQIDITAVDLMDNDGLPINLIRAFSIEQLMLLEDELAQFPYM